MPVKKYRPDNHTVTIVVVLGILMLMFFSVMNSPTMSRWLGETTHFITVGAGLLAIGGILYLYVRRR